VVTKLFSITKPPRGKSGIRLLDHAVSPIYNNPVYFKGSEVRIPRYPVTVIGSGSGRGSAFTATGENQEGWQDNRLLKAALVA
jgi:hypothetical protein